MLKTVRLLGLAGLAGVIALATNAAAQIRPPPVPVGSAECFGDGSGTKCPANNPGLPGRGCQNSTGSGGGLLQAYEVDYPVKHSVALYGSGMPVGTMAIFFQSTGTPRAHMGIAFGDGLLCLKGTQIRLAAKKSVDGAAVFPELRELSLIKAGQIQAPGGTRYYQILYRDFSTSGTPTSGGFNLTNGYKIDWQL
jgi:hypothetical protein